MVELLFGELGEAAAPLLSLTDPGSDGFNRSEKTSPEEFPAGTEPSAYRFRIAHRAREHTAPAQLEEKVMQRRLRTLSLTAAALSAAIVMSACGSDDKTDTTANEAPAATTAPAASAPAGTETTAAAGGGVKLATVKDAKLGDVVTDGSGFVLYRFDKDTAKPPASNCAGDCASTWPPVLASGKPDVTGIDAGLLGTVKRADGSEQVTIDGWPVYRFAADSAAGQTNGQGVGGVWWAVTPTGGKAGAPAPASAPTYDDGYSQSGY
jgi:predicted lipoprotein with Yx(FWY)xxD motif